MTKLNLIQAAIEQAIAQIKVNNGTLPSDAEVIAAARNVVCDRTWLVDYGFPPLRSTYRQYSCCGLAIIKAT